VTFPELLDRWQQCHTLEHKRAFLSWITRPEREAPALDARELARATKPFLSPWLVCCRALACEATTVFAVAALCLPEVEALREAP
jgi:hypothetical protein